MKKIVLNVLLLSSLAGVGSNAAHAALPRVVLDASENRIQGCVVRLWIDGWANQLYVHGVFTGNFGERQSAELANVIEHHLDTGRCNYPGRSALPRLVLDAAEGRIPHLQVRLWVDGWANQLYVSGRFSGNYSETQTDDLVRAIQANDVSRFPRVVTDAVNGAIEGCEVRLLIDGWANQLYVSGRFSGNYRNDQVRELARTIEDHLDTGRCNYRGSRGGYDPYPGDPRRPNPPRVEPPRGPRYPPRRMPPPSPPPRRRGR